LFCALLVIVKCDEMCKKQVFEECVQFEKCHKRFTSFLDVAKSTCGRGKVFCRTNRNPCEIFQAEGLLYSQEDGKCRKPLSDDSCPPGKWLVTTNDEDTLSCQAKPCPDDHILYSGQCQHYSSIICPGPGQVWVVSHQGSAVCLCQQGFVRGEDGRCHQIFTRGYHGYCEDRSIVYESNNMAVCVTNPCPPNNFPHFKTWNGKRIEIGDDLKCHAVSEDINQCEFVDVDRDEELFCSTLVQGDAMGVTSSCLGKKNCCGRRRVMCKYRGICVPKIRG